MVIQSQQRCKPGQHMIIGSHDGKVISQPAIVVREVTRECYEAHCKAIGMNPGTVFDYFHEVSTD